MKLDSFESLLRMAGGFQPAKIFLAANEIDLFTHLSEERDPVQLALDLGVQARGLEILLDALVALGLVDKQQGGYRNAELAQTWLTAGPGYRGHIFKHLNHCWQAWSDLEKILREGHLASPMEKEILGDSERWNHIFINGMDDVTRELAPQVVAQLDLQGVETLMDLGGGPGTYVAAFLERFPQLREVRLFDLPETLEVAREKLAARGLLEQVELIPGDFIRNDLGHGLDAVWISQVLHSQSEVACRLVLEKAWRALNPGGLVLIHEFFLDAERTAPLRAAMFSVHMLVMTDAGRGYTHAEVAAWLGQIGFEGVQWTQVSEDTGVVMGRKPR
ncbi:acetylserotonin O-methyltransferase [Geoalkalibacter halelectricus]|uniref:Acetylserotonin O-methyltransferase n=1 Tax=Geoalkalibacter halelectricus TaxID=2847045 RepID=A0ABY5ZQ65_9BACT|nr:acetylserotonin O-methyltransferase [Geoalkalibacter halelectricus]MDO3377019.1 acetylserotonin O-methyltransferase [Geoalkalibacter halelectricus]UWZ81241.1 acetylserotonin O-methyltransferase [Geoalkalibacter halelectricus]